ncbi:hypothetical protein PHMEG_00038401 [Phytophthora megakarya]|uniref:Uncharacterized protein n=1 Tax=Phytophthora megakarya TaxID=4795 RepID=A0A225UHV3_9STRA|nr:hypothetical protein PHMEG_00038401 [Phytophthora megakarya]
MTRVNFCHNHVRQVGFSTRPVAEGTIPRPHKDMGNTTQDLLKIRRLIEIKMLPMYEGKTERMTGVAISDFLLSRERIQAVHIASMPGYQSTSFVRCEKCMTNGSNS